MEDIFKRLTPIFHDVFEDESIVLSPQMTASDVPDWDSLSNIRLVLAIQKEFQTKFSAAQVANLKNVGDLVELIRAKSATA